MKANIKEQKCIDYVNVIFKKLIKDKIAELEKRRVPIFISPWKYSGGFWKTFVDKGPTGLRKIILVILLLIIAPFVIVSYLIYSPIHSLIRAIEILLGDRKYQRKIKEIKSRYFHDNEVSSKKTFSQLWKTKGLYYSDTWLNYGYKKDCLCYWFTILYDKNQTEFNEFFTTVANRIQKERSDFNKANPGMHNDYCDLEDEIPEEIDKQFGNYDMVASVKTNPDISKDYSRFLFYFEKYPFGSELPVLTLLSSLPPIDRCNIIEQVLLKDDANIEAYSKLSLAYLKSGNKKRAFDLLKNAQANGLLSEKDYHVLSENLMTVEKTYNGNFGSAQTYSDTITTLENRVSDDIKNNYFEFYQLVYEFSKRDLFQSEKDEFIKSVTHFEPANNVSDSNLFLRIKNSGYIFSPSSYEIWMKGKCVKSGNTKAKIVTEAIISDATNKQGYRVSFVDRALSEEISSPNEFDILFESNGRYMMATIPSQKTNNDCIGLSMLRQLQGATRNQIKFESNDPFGSSIFYEDQKITKVSFAFNHPEKLIEFI